MKKKGNAAAENIRVLVRCRPLSEKEKTNGHKSCVDLDLGANTVTVKNVIGEPDRFTFDAVINNSFSQKDIFTQYIMPLTDSVLDGFNATVFAYGQSGSGKTHTMTGVMGNDAMEGVIPRCFKYIFESVKKMKEETPGKTYSMYVSFMELYNGKVRDLLAKQQVSLDIRENKDHTFFVQGAVVAQVKMPEDVIQHLEEGTDRRRTGSTELNDDSSRSHSIFSFVLECVETLEDGGTRAVSSKLNLVDLAGSERQTKTGASGDTLKEGCNINLSLSALGTVIDTIVKGGAHVPFRSSPLTMLLKDSLGGNSKTVMFANINPSERNLSETVSTLRFADRAKQIKNKPVVNMDSKDQKIAELTEIITELRGKLKLYENEGTAGLEDEVTKLREKVGNLEVELHNAQKSREADLVDYDTIKATIATERQGFNAKLVEMEDQVAQMQNNLQISESSTEGLQSQLTDLFALCYECLLSTEEKSSTKPEDLQTLESLDPVLKVAQKKLLEMGSAGDIASLQQQVSNLTAELQTANTETKTTRKELKSTKARLEEEVKETKTALDQALAKVKKLTKQAAAAPSSSSNNNSGGGGGTAAAAASAIADMMDYGAKQQQMLDAVKLDDNGAAAMKLLREENDTLRKKLAAAAKAAAAAAATTPTAAAPAAADAGAAAAPIPSSPQANMVATTPKKGSKASASPRASIAPANDTARASPSASSTPPPDTAALNAIKAELDDEKEKNSNLLAARDKLYKELEAQRAELETAEKNFTEKERAMRELQQSCDAKLAAYAGTEEEITRLETRLRDRTDQLEQLRTLLDKQKAIIVKNNEKTEYFQTSLQEKNAALVAMEQQHRDQLDEKDAQMQRLINERVEEYTAVRSQELDDRVHSYKKLKKKLQKLQDRAAEWEQQYDKKVCECEDLRNALEEQKLEQLRLVRRMEYSDDEAEAMEQKEQIRGALERAKQERRRKNDLFSMGEVKSAKSTAHDSNPSNDSDY